MKGYPSEVGSYDRARNKAIAKIRKAADGDDLLDMVFTEVDPKQREERDANVQAVRMVVEKCLDEYREGAYDTFPTAIKKLCTALGKLK